MSSPLNNLSNRFLRHEMHCVGSHGGECIELLIWVMWPPRVERRREMEKEGEGEGKGR